MLVDTFAGETQTMRKLGAYFDALSKFDNGITRIKAEMTTIDDEEYQKYIKKIQQLK